MSARPLPLELAALTSGSPVYLGTITSAGSTTNNHTTTTTAAFYNSDPTLGARVLLLQPSAAGYILSGTTNAAAVTAVNGVKLAADERVIICMGASHGWLAFLPSSGAATLKVWELV